MPIANYNSINIIHLLQLKVHIFLMFQNKKEEFKLRIYEVAHTWTIKAYLKFIMIKNAISITICLYPQVVYLFNTKAMEMSGQIELKQKI